MASPFIQAHYGWSFINHFLNNMRKAGVINCLKKYKEIQEFKFGELVGVDKFGNRYYEDKNESLLRDRWVEFSDYSDGIPDASRIPPEWHAWIHRITDSPGGSPQFVALTPKYKREWRPNPTGGPLTYTPPNFVLNPEYRGAKNSAARTDRKSIYKYKVFENQQ
eukprot:Phypoly_transcript_20105.p1 GENE.Phypoly_transcript_20105~~Phypoly_transcript_20105.p1  ORF type:complete len:164 (+),score=15.02 Phypoly_transcript_20105:53-544(+)